jgi:hypothetical protein
MKDYIDDKEMKRMADAPRIEHRREKLKLNTNQPPSEALPDRAQNAPDGAKRSCPFPYIFPIDDCVSPFVL